VIIKFKIEYIFDKIFEILDKILNGRERSDRLRLFIWAWRHDSFQTPPVQVISLIKLDRKGTLESTWQRSKISFCCQKSTGRLRTRPSSTPRRSSNSASPTPFSETICCVRPSPEWAKLRFLSFPLCKDSRKTPIQFQHSFSVTPGNSLIRFTRNSKG